MKKCILLVVLLSAILGKLCAQWENQLSGNNNYLESIQFIDKSFGIAGAIDAITYSTTNAGATWIKNTALYGGSISNLFCVDKNIALFVDHSYSNKCRITTDGFKTATTFLELPTIAFHSEFNKIYCYNNTTWVLCSYGLTYNSTDLENWTTKNWDKDYNFIYMKFFNNDTGYLAANHDGIAILKTTDGGKSWTEKVFATNKSIKAFFFVDENYGWAITYSQVVYKTTDGGTNWEENDIQDYNFNDISFINRNEGWIVGKSGVILSTTDGGVNWDIDNSATGEDLHCIYSNKIDESTYNIYAAGGASTIVYNRHSVITSVDNELETSTCGYIISPNPATDKISIFTNKGLHSDLQSSSFSIINSLGMEIRRIEGKELSVQGEICFSTNELPSGVYYVRHNIIGFPGFELKNCKSIKSFVVTN